MKIIYFVILLIPIMLFSQNEEDVNVNFLQSGKWYVSRVSTNPELVKTRKIDQDPKPFLIEIIEPVIGKREVTISRDSLDFISPDNDEVRIKIGEEYELIGFIEGKIPFVDSKFVGYGIFTTMVPAKWTVLNKLSVPKDGISITMEYVIEKARIVKKDGLVLSKVLTEKQKYFEGGETSELISLTSHFQDAERKSKEIEMALIKLGYKLNVDENKRESLKKAIADFQRRNGLKEGALDIATLKLLGIKL